LLDGLRPELLLPSLPPLSEGAGVLVAEVEAEVGSEVGVWLLEATLLVIMLELRDVELTGVDELRVELDVLVDEENVVEDEDEVLVTEVDDDVLSIDDDIKVVDDAREVMLGVLDVVGSKDCGMVSVTDVDEVDG
jgi:hypothetical protein